MAPPSDSPALGENGAPPTNVASRPPPHPGNRGGSPTRSSAAAVRSRRRRASFGGTGSVSSPPSCSTSPPGTNGPPYQQAIPPYQQHAAAGHDQPPLQHDDDGAPSSSMTADLYRALHLIYDERHLVAYDLYRDARGRVEELDTCYRSAQNGHSDAAEPSPHTKNGNHPHGPKLHFISPTAALRNLRAAPPRFGHHGGDAAAANGNANNDPTRSDWEQAKLVLERNEAEFDRLEKRARLFLRAKQNLTIDDDWIKAQTLFGITTYYRRETDGSLSIKLEGHLTGIPLFEQLAVLREADLYHSWAPFCVKSRRLAQLGKIDVVAWFLTGLPQFGLSRDACFRAVGCDSMREDGSVLLVGEGLGDRPEDGVGGDDETATNATGTQADANGSNMYTNRRSQQPQQESGSIHNDSSNYAHWNSLSDEYEYGSYLSRDDVLDTIQLPPVPQKLGAGRMTIRSFQGVIDVLSPSSARTRIVTNIDPNLRFVPQSLIDFVMKKMCGILLSRLQSTARNIVKDPVHSIHARRMREDVQFYRLWLLPKFRLYCQDLGWELPPVAALNVSEEDLDEEEWLMYSQLKDSGPDIRRANSDGAVAADQGRPMSLDGNPTSRRLFQSDGGGSPDRSAVSLRPRNKLRQLLPSDSMEFALTSPELVKRWEQKRAKKKALAVASARRKAALRLRPAKPNEEQTKRLAQLMEAKERFLERKGPKGWVSPKSRGADGHFAFATDDADNMSLTEYLIEIGSCTHMSLPHRTLLPIALVLMSIIYHSEHGLGYQSVEESFQNGSQLIFKRIYREVAFSGLLVIYGIIHWCVLNLALIVGFDFIELPISMLTGAGQGLHNAKVLFTHRIRKITGLATLTILALVLGSTLLSSCWTYAVLTYFPLSEWHFVERMARFAENLVPSGLIDKFSVITWPFEYIIGWIASIIGWIGVLTPSMLKFSLAPPIFAVCTVLSEWIGSGVGAILDSLFDVDPSSLDWRSATLGTSKIVMSYSTSFLLSFILFARMAFPKRNINANGVTSDNVKMGNAMHNSGATKPLDTVQEGVTADTDTFSLASGEITNEGEMQSFHTGPALSFDNKSSKSRGTKTTQKLSSVRSL